MLHNNNFKGNLNLAKRIYKESKARNFILRVAIFLTTVLGTISLHCIFTMEALNREVVNPTEGYASIIEGLDNNYTKERIIGIGNYVESKEYKNISFDDKNIYLKFTSHEGLKEVLKDKVILGEMPTSPNELLLPTWMISGEEYDKEENWRNIYFNTSSMDGSNIVKNKRIYNIVGYYEEEKPLNDLELVEVYSLIDYENSSITTLIICFIFITLISGYLLIANIFHTSVVKETRLYGIFKTIGLGKNGLKYIIYYQGLLNYLFITPIGLILGMVLSKLFTPKLLGLTSLKEIYIKPNVFKVCFISAIFILIVIYLCCKKPINYLNKVSPVEASKFIGGEKNITKTTMRHIRENNILSRIAMYNIFTNERKSLSTILSICISGVTIILSLVYYISFNTSDILNNKYQSDFILDTQQISSAKDSIVTLTPNITEEIRALSYVTSVTEVKEKVSSYNKDDIKINGVRVNNKPSFKFLPYTEEEKYKFGISIDGIRNISAKCDNDRMLINNEDYTSYYNSNGIIVSNLPMNLKNKYIYLDFYVNGEIISKEFKVIDVIEDSNIAGVIMSEKNYIETFNSEPSITSIQIQIKSDDYLEVADKEILNIIREHGLKDGIVFTSKYNIINDLKNKRDGLFFIGIVLSFFIGMIGFISIINSMLSSVISRSVEFALFESIGMTKKQQCKMLILEGLNYSLYTSVILIPTSFITNIFVLANTSIEGEFNFIIYLLSLIFVISIITIIMIIIPLICFKYLKNKTIVSRIRECEII